LPNSWETLYQLTKLDDEQFEAGILGDLICPDMTQGEIRAANRKFTKAADEERVLGTKPVAGRHKTLIIDPPWDYGQLSLAGRGAVTYATMTNDELAAMPVPAWAEDDCHLYLWTTNNFLPIAIDLTRTWGFQHKTVLTWCKPRWGLGSYFRNSTEQCLFAIKGSRSTRVDNIATHFEAPLGEHSAKPEIFYEIVQRASYPRIGEAFQRTTRAGIANLFEGREAAQ
jgi:N6-adenosine-specific RNA methylase IME4